ncbi:hypothetical protein EV200_109157 [Pedobacter psychrotolerans]|uniref:SMI1/KNR4 family protein SUKH-1 n=1 Tax=Pedobacter psychrotolerans TaxID=1843235 RepID=A0A4R2H488_9SPHI|nr:hypothetical protein [Pedobacter psychrotolerans]TCO19973.1 hypothetical protein EV200_109157 [Pedobacter psychrotolerans]GGE50205.1 hypothetical protein GCM10011413_15540 [Pedobacter psychrotolerans]
MPIVVNHIKFTNILIACNWRFEETQVKINTATAQDMVKERLSKTPSSFLEFVEYFDLLANAEDNIWFISIKDYLKENNGEGFSWNEFELQSLEYSDGQEKKDVIKFWNDHLPFMMSVKSDYAYVAIVLNGEDKGQIVTGNKPEYEDTVTLANSLEEFFEKYVLVLKGQLEEPALKLFI